MHFALHGQVFHEKGIKTEIAICFFQVFDPAWKAMKEKPNIVKNGFVSTGLVPFDVDRVNFNKIIDTSIIQKHNENANTPQAVKNASVKLGVLRAFKILEGKLELDMKINFEKRFIEGYNLEDKTPKGVLWSVYKELRKLSNEVNTKNDTSIQPGNADNKGNNGVPSIVSVLSREESPEPFQITLDESATVLELNHLSNVAGQVNLEVPTTAG